MTREPEDLPRRLGPELWALAENLGSRVTKAVTLTRLPSTVADHATYRLELADGRRVKGRRVQTRAQVERMVRIVPLLERQRFGGILAHAGRAVVEPWIEGARFDAAPRPRSLVAACGAALARVHARPAPGGLGGEGDGPVSHLRTLERRLADLVSGGQVAPTFAARTLRVAHRFAAPATGRGYVHGDYCADNLVVTGADVAVCVDNETVGTGSIDYDLARTWWRWPMSAEERTAFLRGYRRHRDPANFSTHLPFWAAVVLVDSVSYRLEAATGGVDEPLGRLTRLVEAAGDARPGRGGLAAVEV